MEYLLAFQDYVQTGNTSRNVPFSPQLRESLQKVHQETAGMGWPLQFEILAPPSEKTVQTNTVKEIQYTGKFVYGFYKNGMWYETPEENSRTHQEKPIDEGAVHFRFGGDGKTIETVYETFAGNTYGKQPLGVGRNNLKRLYFFLGLGLVLMLLLRLL